MYQGNTPNSNESLITALVGSKADKNSPEFTGVPKGPTAPVDTNNTQLATTAFVQTTAAAVAANAVSDAAVPSASTTVAGKIMIASSGDTSSTDKAVTPASMANFVNNAINKIGDYNGVYGFGVYTIFKTPGVTTFNTPAGVTEARVTVIGPGGNGIDPTTGALAAGGGGGGFAQGVYPVSGSYNVTVGSPGGSSSFGTLISATSGENGSVVAGVLVGGAGGVGIGGNRINRAGGRGTGGPISPVEYIDFTELQYPEGTGVIPSGVTTVNMVGKGGDALIEGAVNGTLTLTDASGSGTLPAVTTSVVLSGKGEDGLEEGAGAGKPWVKQYAFNDIQSTDITGWTTGTPLPAALGYSHAVVTKNRVYLLGGHTDYGGYISTVYTAPINPDGTIGAWATGTSLPDPLAISEAVVTKNRVYLLGGSNGYRGFVSTAYTATINSDGTIGAWTTGTPLPAALGHSQAVVTKNRVYLLGGHNGGGGYTSTVYTAPINSDGTIGAWATGTSLPSALSVSEAVVTKNRVYLLGGHNGTKNTSTVYTATINSDGTIGAWTTGTPMPGDLSVSQAVVTKNRVYLLGGGNSSGYVSTVYTAPINSDGTIGAWATGTSLPDPLAVSQAVVTKNRVYLLGGNNGTNYISTVYTAPFAGGLNDYSTIYGTSGLSGTPATITLNGTIYTFPGGTAGVPAVTTTHNVTLPGTAAVSYSYSKPGTTPQLSISYSSNAVGLPTTITVNGVAYTFQGGVNGPAVQTSQTAYLTGSASVNYSYSIAPGGLGSISYQVASGPVTGTEGTAGGGSGVFPDVFVRDAYGNVGGGYGGGMDTSLSTPNVTSIGHNFSGGGGNDDITGGGKGGIGGGGGGGATGGDGLVIVEW